MPISVVKEGKLAGASNSLLEVNDLHTHIQSGEGVVRAVRGVSFKVQPSERLAIVGESGSGKTIAALSVISLLPPAASVVRGSVTFAGRSLKGLSDKEMSKLRGTEMSIIFQDPMSALDPLKTVAQQVSEPLLVHRVVGRRGVDAVVLDLLDEVGLPNPRRVAAQYPYELSGGMHQRVTIAIALACRPRLLIADEPTTALDPTLQAQIMELLTKLSEERRMAIVLITHDMGAVARIAQRVAIFYAGKIVEQGSSEQIFYGSRHPYTRGLIESIPGTRAREPLATIPGIIANPVALPRGCVFHPRCFLMKGRDLCAAQEPPLIPAGEPDHLSACHYSQELEEAVRDGASLS